MLDFTIKEPWLGLLIRVLIFAQRAFAQQTVFHQKQDLIRFGVHTKKLWFSHVPNGERRTIFAIPQAARDAIQTQFKIQDTKRGF